jgi:thiosulfate reductase cytochrome b subunit
MQPHGTAAAPDATRDDRRREQPWPVRLTHWVAVPTLAVMAASGLQIYAAYPYLGPRGRAYAWFPLQGVSPPGWLRLGDWLAGARHVHFAVGWILLANALIYSGWLAGSGEWRRRAFAPRRDGPDALATALGYLRLRAMPAKTGLYNGLQRAAYTSALLLGVVEVASGIAIWKPVQLRWLGAIFGGYDGARAAHLLGLLGLAAFAVGHLVMVATHPRTLWSMITGGPRG